MRLKIVKMYALMNRQWQNCLKMYSLAVELLDYQEKFYYMENCLVHEYELPGVSLVKGYVRYLLWQRVQSTICIEWR